MNIFKPLLVTLVLLSLITDVTAQTSRRRGARRPSTAAPTTDQSATQPDPAPAPISTAPRTPIPLATLNGQTISSADIEPNVGEEIEGLEDKIAEARRQVTEMQINTALLEAEAAKRRVTPQQLYEQEIAGRITEPTPAEIAKVTDENRDQLAQADPAAVKQQVVDFLKGEREGQLTTDLIKRLKISYPVVMVAPDGSANLAASAVIATVGGRPISAGTIEERLKPIIYKLRLNTYQLAKQAVELHINNTLLIAEANRRNVGADEIVRKEVSDKIHAPTQAEIAKFYEENKARVTADLPTISNQIATYLQEQERQRLEQDLSNRLRSSATIRMLISEPALPVQSISADDDPVRGDVKAPVTIVEFTDFQCSACAALQPMLEEVFKAYGNKVRLVVRDFPLAMHANSRKAAEAANAANAQNKFFEYTALLFQRQNALDVPSLKKYATEVGLNRAQFDAALDGDRFAAEIKHDMDEGVLYGVDSTPGVFVNGVALRELSVEALRALIDRALTASGTTPKASTN
ncbi:MAG TPA: thioredoxin domain-containing protein [Pyrinomonadaceae bacterium]|nr:thioredoxin domain-containing protein [Pyrinomonadaceae bacterium]